MWKYFVIARDVNSATPDMDSEEAAQIIGGMVLTHQLTINFDGGECPVIPDGQVLWPLLMPPGLAVHCYIDDKQIKLRHKARPDPLTCKTFNEQG